MHLLGMLVCLVLVAGHCALCVLPQIVHFLFYLSWHGCYQKLLFWQNVCLVFHNPFPQLLSRQSVLRIELHQIAHDTSENLWVMFGVFPSVDQVTGCSLVKSECLQVINAWWVFQNTCSNYSQSNWKKFWWLILFIINGTQLQLSDILWGQKGIFLVNGLLVIGLFIWKRVKWSNLGLSFKVNENILRSNVTNFLANSTHVMKGTHQTVQQVPEIRLPESLLFFMPVYNLLRKQVREVIVVNLMVYKKKYFNVSCMRAEAGFVESGFFGKE